MGNFLTFAKGPTKMQKALQVGYGLGCFSFLFSLFDISLHPDCRTNGNSIATNETIKNKHYDR